jgi:hypothetical protein
MDPVKRPVFAAIVSRVSAMLLHPKTAWETIAGEDASVSDVLRYVATIAAVTACIRLVKGVGFAPTVALYVLDVGMILVLARILCTLGRTAGTSLSFRRCMQLLGYGATASYLSTAIALMLGVPGLLVAIAGYIYACVTIYSGLRTLANIPDIARPKTGILLLCAQLVLGLVYLAVSSPVPQAQSQAAGGNAQSIRTQQVMQRNAQYGRQSEEMHQQTMQNIRDQSHRDDCRAGVGYGCGSR